MRDSKWRLKSINWKQAILLVILTTLLIGIVYVQHSDTYRYDMKQLVAPLNFQRNYDKPKILQYSTFFGTVDSNMIAAFKKNFTGMCDVNCVVTDEKDEIGSADGVLFHLKDIVWHGTQYLRSDTGIMFSFPTFRHPDQVWVLYNQEPLSLLWGSLGTFQWVFNWTLSYRRDSDVFVPYGIPRKVDMSERNIESMRDEDNYFKQKTQDGAIAMISNCKDDARRYKLIEYLKKYINVKVYGRCGEGRLDSSKEDIQKQYKFYLAFENSNCVDYVTEKYWRSLTSGQIPLVAWRNNMTGVVIPESYINIFDFTDITKAGEYIKRVNDNATLYNSYFKWKEAYETHSPRALCELCKKLHEKAKRRQVYLDFKGWLTNDTCQQLTVSIACNH